MARRSHAPDSARNRPVIEQKPIVEQPQPTETVQDYTSIRLTRVRLQLDRLDAMAAEETDTKRLKELADATSRLQEQERQLAGRPLPGTLKPSTRAVAQRPAISATYPVAQPVVVDPPKPEQ